MVRVPLGTRLAYGAPGLAFALVGIPVYVHLPKFYADTLGVDLAFVGAAILASRLWDAVTDPAVGYLSDRTRTRFGRRRPFLLAGSLPLAAGAAFLMWPPAWPPAMLGWWFAAWLFVVFLAWTAVQIPHAALGAELTTDPHERTALFAVRDALWIVGTLVAAAAPSLVRLARGHPAGDEREVFATLAWIYGVGLLALPWLCALLVAEPPSPPAATPAPVRATREAWDNRPFRVMLVAYGIGALGAALPGTLVLFYVEHVLQAPALAEAFLAAYFLVGVLCLPVWTRVARRIGRKRAWLVAMTLSVASFSGAFFLGPGDTWWFAAITIVSGAGFGAGLVLPAALVADTIDYDEWRAGHRREGLYYGLWSIVTKVSAALGAAAAFPILKWSGYVPNAAAQPESVMLALQTMYSLVPCVCYAAALLVAARFPLDDGRHAEIRRALDERAARHDRGEGERAGAVVAPSATAQPAAMEGGA